MLRKDIERAFTDKISEYFAAGYTIYYTSMGGHQGELAKVDLTNGKEIIRIFLDSKNEYRVEVENRHVDLRYISLIVGRCVDNVRIGCRYDTIWNEKLEIISEEKFYEIGKHENNFFGTREEAINAALKRYNRFSCGRAWSSDDIIFNDKAKEIILPWVKRQKKCKSVNVKQIDEVKKVIYYNRKNIEVHYYVKAKGQVFKIR